MMKQNDIYSWRWKDVSNDSFSYHCKSGIAVFFNGGLRDTFWYDWETRPILDQEKVEITFLGNSDECFKVNKWKIHYYDRADIIDMRHSNNSNAPIYLKTSAIKSQAAMLEYAEEKRRQAHSDMVRAECEISEWEEKVRRIKSGDLEVYL